MALRNWLQNLLSQQQVDYQLSANAPADTTPAPMVTSGLGNGPWPMDPQRYSISTILDNNGNGSVSLGPVYVREHFQVTSASVQVSTANKEAQCSVYVGSTIISNTFFGTTQTGSTGDTCAIGQDIQTGQQVFAVWTGGDAGSTATMTLNGTRTIGAGNV